MICHLDEPGERCPRYGWVFRALSDPSCRSLLDNLNQHDGQMAWQLCAGLAMA